MTTAPSVPPTRSCLPPTLVGTCHTCFFKKTKCMTICMPGSRVSYI
jgi:hypothetical protein